MTTVFVLSAYTLQGEPVGTPRRRLTGLPIRIGRNDLNDFAVQHPVVSSFHARIEDIAGRLCIIDLGSKNGVHVHDSGAVPRRIPPNEPTDLAPSFQFYLGAHIRVQIEFDRARDALALRTNVAATGNVLGNRQILLGPSTPDPTGRSSSVPPAAAPPHHHSGAMPSPVPPAMHPSQVPAMHPSQVPPMHPSQVPPMHPSHPGLPAQAPPHLRPLAQPPMPAHAPLPAHAPPPAQAPFHQLPPQVQHLQPSDPLLATQSLNLSIDTLALQGLRELAASLVPGVPLESTGDVARFITKIHDALEVFCRTFIPLRDGYSQFVSSLDLQRASVRTAQRSTAYRSVEAAHTPEAMAMALLNPKDRSFDAPNAVEGILADLMLHQLALLEGVMRGVRALLEELSPENIERNAGTHLPLGKYKALWQTYERIFEDLYEERQTFAVIFGPEFTAAYRQYRAGKRTGNETEA